MSEFSNITPRAGVHNRLDLEHLKIQDVVVERMRITQNPRKTGDGNEG